MVAAREFGFNGGSCASRVRPGLCHPLPVSVTFLAPGTASCHKTPGHVCPVLSLSFLTCKMGALAVWWFLPRLLAPKALGRSWGLRDPISGLRVQVLSSADDLCEPLSPAEPQFPSVNRSLLSPLGGHSEHATGLCSASPSSAMPCWECQACIVHAATRLELLPGTDAAGSLLIVRKKMGIHRTEATGCVETSALRMGEGEKVGQALEDGKAQPGSSLAHTLH